MLETEQHHLSIISDFAMDTKANATVHDLVWHLATNVVARLGFEDVVIYLFDQSRDMLSQMAAYGNKNGGGREIVKPLEIAVGQGVVGNVALSGVPRLIQNTNHCPEYLVDDERRLSELAVPMMAEGRLVGVIDSEHRLEGFFSEQHQRTLVAIASMAATKIIKAQSKAELQNTIAQLEYSKKLQASLFEISELTFNTSALSEFYRGLHQCIGKLMFSKNFYVALACRDGKSIRFPYNVNEFDNIPIDKTYSLDAELPGITEYVLTTSKPLLLNYLDMIRLISQKEFNVRGKIPKQWLAVPFDDEQQDSGLRGVVAMQSYYDEQAFGEKDKQLLMYVAKHIRNAIERVNAAKALKLTNENLQKTNLALDEARMEAEQASRLKSTFVANISHELRTPLTAIIGFSEQALKTQNQIKLQKEFLTRVLKSGQHLLELLNEILDLSKIEADKLELLEEPLELFEFIDNIEAVSGVLAREKSLSFTVKYMYPLPKVINCDPVRLKQILLNICNNAVKFTLAGGVRLTVAVDKNSRLTFVVSDSGIGMSADELKRLFKPFVQADANINRQFGGTGLGLAISKRLVRLMDGELLVESVKDEGSVFTVQLPLSDESLQWVETKPLGHVEMTQEEVQHRSFDANILVAEDNSDNQFLIKTLLAHIGAKVTTVDNGQMAVEAAMLEDYDLILMDIQMPTMDGCEAVNLLRHSGIDCPIIALTANIMKEDVDKYMALGFNDTLAKPIQLQSFYKKLTFYLEQGTHGNNDMDNLLLEIENTTEIKNLKASFKAGLGQLKSDFAELILSADWQRLAAKAHQVKGSAGSLGYAELTDSAGRIEQYLKNDQFDEARLATEAFIAQCEQAL